MLTNSLNMFPSGAFHDSANRLFVHAERACKCACTHALCVMLANVAYVLFSQPRLFHGFAAWSSFWMQSGVVLIAAWQAIRMGARSVPSLCGHVCHVVIVGSQKQMMRTHTRGGVTCMANLYSWWNIAIHQLPNNAVRKVLAIVSPYLSISFVVAIASPQPAGIGFVNLRPQPIFKGAHAALISTRAAAMNLAGIVSGKGARTVGAGFVVYNSHVGSSFQAIGHATAVSAARGFLMLNYTIKSPPERHPAIIKAMGLRHVPIQIGVAGSEVVYRGA